MDRNLGAIRVATSSIDDLSYGHLYQWGRSNDGHEARTSDISDSLSNMNTPENGDFIFTSDSPHDWRSPQNDNLWQGIDGVNNPCPQGYRIPTQAEWDEERASWSSQNAEGAFASPLKLPMAGSRSSVSTHFILEGSKGSYWSSTINGPNVQHLNFSNDDSTVFSIQRGEGLCVRCIQD